jgi:Ca2+-binding RTX toxin-like protein
MSMSNHSYTRAAVRAIGAAAATAIATLPFVLSAPAAHAAPCYGDCQPGVVRMIGGSLRYDAPVGVNDQITVTGSGMTFTVSDPPATFSAGAGCTMVTPHQAQCTTGIAGFSAVFRGLDGNDVITNNTSLAARINGGSGDDRLVGGSGDDILVGEFGADRLQGGAGNDTASYGDFSNRSGVHADLDGATGDDGGTEDGPAGARDTIAADIENLEGTIQNDVLTGNAGPNIISGSGGHDQIQGLGGNDTLTGRGGGTVNGGANTDHCISDLRGLLEQPDTFVGCESTEILN